MDRHKCTDCKHRQYVFLPCEWIKKRAKRGKKIVVACPYYEKEK